MTDNVCDDVKAYCEAFDLLFLNRDRLLELDPTGEEYAGVRCMGVFRDVHIVCVVYVNASGTCRVVERWADGIKIMEDRFRTFTGEQLRSAIAICHPLHPED